MGIAGLPNHIKTKHPSLFKTIDLSIYSGHILGIDTSIYMYKYKSLALKTVINDTVSYVDIDRCDPLFDINVERVGRLILQQFYSLFEMLNYINIRALFIFDGDRPQEKKDKAHLERQSIKDNQINKFNMFKQMWINKDYTMYQKHELYTEIIKCRGNMFWPTHEDYDILLNMLHHFKIAHVVSSGEADNLCAFLAISKYVFGIYSIDSDLYAYGVPLVITNMSLYYDDNNKPVVEATVIKTFEIYDALNLTSQQFIDFCILCGTDYNHGIDDIGTVGALKLIQAYKTLEKVGDILMRDDIITQAELNSMILIREKFLNRYIMSQRHVYNYITSMDVEVINNKTLYGFIYCKFNIKKWIPHTNMNDVHLLEPKDIPPRSPSPPPNDGF